MFLGLSVFVVFGARGLRGRLVAFAGGDLALVSVFLADVVLLLDAVRFFGARLGFGLSAAETGVCGFAVSTGFSTALGVGATSSAGIGATGDSIVGSMNG